MNNLSKYFEQLADNDKISHSFLIGNVNFDDIKDELFKVINKYIFKTNNNLENNPDLYILRLEKGNISKERIKELIMNITTTSQFNDKKVYIIEASESLNDFAYNAILKTLKEPSDNIYAFLLTTNISAVKPTIVSRCQKLFVSSNIKEEEFSEDVINLGNEVIDIIENNNIDSLGLQNELYGKITDRNVLSDMLKYIMYEYYNSINSLALNNDIDNVIVNNNSIDKIAKKILVINDNINNVNYNLNKNLSIDRFLIEMWRC